MFKISIIFIIILLIQQSTARHIINSLKVDTKVSLRVETKTSSLDLAIEQSLQEQFKIKRDAWKTPKNCHCLYNGRCSKRTICLAQDT